MRTLVLVLFSAKIKINKVVEYAMAGDDELSSTVIAKYETELISKDILQEKLDELYEIAEEAEGIDKE